jgi:hypothetical protein
MPCYDERSTATYAEAECRKKLQTMRDQYAQMLCACCSALEGKGLPIPPAAKSWWAAHKQLDAKRALEQDSQTDPDR